MCGAFHFRLVINAVLVSHCLFKLSGLEKKKKSPSSNIIIVDSFLILTFFLSCFLSFTYTEILCHHVILISRKKKKKKDVYGSSTDCKYKSYFCCNVSVEFNNTCEISNCILARCFSKLHVVYKKLSSKANQVLCVYEIQ